MQMPRNSAISFDKTTTTQTPTVVGVHKVAFKALLTTAQMRTAGKSAELAVRPLRHNIHVVSGSGGNVLVSTGPNGKLIVDSGLATSRLQMISALNSISAQPTRYLINTHWHFDHTDGNDWMHAAGARIFAHENTLSRMQRQQVIPEFEGVYPPRTIGALPHVTFAQTETLTANGQTVIMKRFTPAHTDTDISVLFTEADVLHTGDTFFSGFYPFIDYSSGGSIDGMILACRETLALSNPSTIIVCGHGPTATYSDVVAFLQMLIEIKGTVANLKQSGASAEEVISLKPSAPFDAKWGTGFIPPDLFTLLVYMGT